MTQKLVLFLTRNTGLQDWESSGILDRELRYYKRLMERGFDITFVSQGDEPLILASAIEAVIEATLKPGSSVINAMAPITAEEEFFNLNIPKVVFDENKKLLYMSRSSVPISKDGKFVRAHKQVCIYGFKRETLLAVMAANTKTANEAIEDIEILRFLDKGYDVQMVPVSGSSIAVDTEQDLKKVKELIKN